MTKKKLFNELRVCKRVALSCETCESALISIQEARGMIKLAYMYDIINDKQFHTLMHLSREFFLYVLESKSFAE